MKIKSFFIYSILTASFAAFSVAQAKEINLYDQPVIGAKSVGKVDLSAGIIPIFTQKDGKWVKIADPRNGNVGWVPATDLNTNPHTSFVYTQRVMDGNKGTDNYQVFQFGNPKPLTPEQMKSLQQWQQQQQAIQQNFQKSMQDMIQNMNSLYKQSMFPIVMPVVVVPSQPVSSKK